MPTRNMHRMVAAIRRCRIVTVIVWMAIFARSAAFAQPDDGNPIREQIPPVPIATTAETNPVPTPQIIVSNPCYPDYWIVSTRGCRDQIEAGQGVNYDVLRFDGPNPGTTSSMDHLLSTLQPGVPVCFMTHGSFVTWDSMLNDSAGTYRWLRQAAPCQPIHIIFYTWCSNDGGFIPHVHINIFGRRASLNGLYLADLISKVSTDHPVCLIGHSHGTRLVSSALHAMAGGTVEERVLASGPQPLRRIRIVFAAAALDHHWLKPGERYDRALCPVEAAINLRNFADFPLLFYPLRRPLSSRALAISGLTPRDRASLGDSQQKLVDYSVTDLVGGGHIWSHYYKHPEIADVIRHYVYFDN